MTPVCSRCGQTKYDKERAFPAFYRLPSPDGPYWICEDCYNKSPKYDEDYLIEGIEVAIRELEKGDVEKAIETLRNLERGQ